MNRFELLKIINESDNMELTSDLNRYHNKQSELTEDSKKCGIYDRIKDYSKINTFAEEFDGICFSRIEKSTSDKLEIRINESFFRYNKKLNFTAVEMGYVRNCCGFIEFFYMTEDGIFFRVSDYRTCIPERVIAENEDDFIKYLLTKEYDYHIPITEETYRKLREAGWYEGRHIDISEIIRTAEEHNVILTDEQKRFLEEYAGIASPDPYADDGFYIAAEHKCHNLDRHFENPNYEKNCDPENNKRVPICIGCCYGYENMVFLSPEGLLMYEQSVQGRTVMEGWQILLVGHERS